MHQSILNGSEIVRIKNAVAAGTTNQSCTTIDGEGFEVFLFIVALGALTATQVTSLKVGGGAASDGSDATDLAGTKVGPAADADSNKLLILEVVRPAGFRYLTLTVNRGTANAVIDSAICIKSGPCRKSPTSQGTTVSASKSSVSPAEGTP